MAIRIEHDEKGQHRSTFRDFENVGSLATVVLTDDCAAIVIFGKDNEKRFVLVEVSNEVANGK